MNTHDPIRAASARLQGPFMLAPGRAIVDAQGNTVATVYGYHLEAPSDRDALAHAVCAAMNATVSNGGRMYDGVAYSPLEMASAKRGSKAWLAAAHGVPCTVARP